MFVKVIDRVLCKKKYNMPSVFLSFTLQVHQKPNKPCSFDCVKDIAARFDDLIKSAKWMDRRFPPCNASASKKSPKTWNMIYSKYDNLPGAFRLHLMLSGLWEYKHCCLNEWRTKPEQVDVMLPDGGETENVCIASTDLVLDKNPFDSGVTCRMFKGSLKRNSVSLDIACNEYLVKMTYKYKLQIEKEFKCL